MKIDKYNHNNNFQNKNKDIIAFFLFLLHSTPYFLAFMQYIYIINMVFCQLFFIFYVEKKYEKKIEINYDKNI